MRVLVGRHGQRQTLVDGATGDPVEFGSRGLQQRQAAVECDLHDLADAVVDVDPLGDRAP